MPNKNRKKKEKKRCMAEGKNACMEILSVGGIYERTSKTKDEFEEAHY